MKAKPPPVEQDFDPTRALDGWHARSHEGAPELDLAALRTAQGPALTPERVAELRRRGFSMQNVEDVNFNEPESD